MLNKTLYCFYSLVFFVLINLVEFGKAVAIDGSTVWDNKCEECHGDPTQFSKKYLWNVDGRLQGQHHINDFDLYLRQHYVPDYALKSIQNLLLNAANSPLQFNSECSHCHGEISGFVKDSIWVRGNRITGLDSGKDLREFLPGHETIKTGDINFYLKLFARTAGKPFYIEEPLLEAITR